MNIGSEILIGKLYPFSSYISDGWKEGFDISWSDFPNDEIYTNTLLNQTNYGDSNNQSGGGQGDLHTGNKVTATNTFSGWKFLYKPYDSKNIQWVLLYVVLHGLTNGNDHYHYYANNYFLSIDGKTVIHTDSSNSDGNQVKYTSDLGVTPKFGGICNSSNLPSGVNNCKLGALPSFQMNSVAKGTTECVFYGKFNRENDSTPFNIQFTYVNTAYIWNTNGWYIKCYSKTPAKWNTSTEWYSYGGSFSQFADKKFLYSVNAPLAPGTPIVCKSGGTVVSNVSYGQNPVVVYSPKGGKYVSLDNLTSGTGWQSAGETYSTGISYNLINIKPKGSANSEPNPITARASFWNTGSWQSSKELTVQYSPNSSKVKKTITWGSNRSSVKIVFDALTPVDNNGYFNYLRIKHGDNQFNITREFYSKKITINIVRDQDTGILSIEGSDSAGLGGLDAFDLEFECYCSKSNDSTLWRGHTFTLHFDSIEQEPETEQTQVQNVEVDFPNNSNDSYHIYMDSNGVAKTNICLSVQMTQEIPAGKKIIVQYGSQQFNFTDPLNFGDLTYLLKLNDVQIETGVDTISISTDVEKSETAELPFTPTIHEYVDYSEINSGEVIDNELLMKLREQMNYQWQNFFKYFRYSLNSGEDYWDVRSENLMNVKISDDSVVLQRVFREDFYSLSGDYMDCIVYSPSLFRAYMLPDDQQIVSGIKLTETPFYDTSVRKFIFNSAGNSLWNDDYSLYIHEDDDIQKVGGNEYDLQDRLITNLTKSGSKYIVNYSTNASSSKKALFIQEEGKYNMIIADPRVTPKEGKLIVLTNYQKAMLYMLSIYSDYTYGG